MPSKLAEYKCQTCGHRWKEKPGRVTCPVCVIEDPDIATWKAHYCTWLNYNEMFGTRGVAEDNANQRLNRKKS